MEVSLSHLRQSQLIPVLLLDTEIGTFRCKPTQTKVITAPNGFNSPPENTTPSRRHTSTVAVATGLQVQSNSKRPHYHTHMQLEPFKISELSRPLSLNPLLSRLRIPTIQSSGSASRLQIWSYTGTLRMASLATLRLTK